MATVSEHDREHFRKLGRWKYASHRDALREHLALSGRERLVRSFRMMLAGPMFAAQYPMPDDDHPEEFYERARRLGLYRP